MISVSEKRCMCNLFLPKSPSSSDSDEDDSDDMVSASDGSGLPRMSLSIFFLIPELKYNNKEALKRMSERCRQLTAEIETL